MLQAGGVSKSSPGLTPLASGSFHGHKPSSPLSRWILAQFFPTFFIAHSKEALTSCNFFSEITPAICLQKAGLDPALLRDAVGTQSISSYLRQGGRRRGYQKDPGGSGRRVGDSGAFPGLSTASPNGTSMSMVCTADLFQNQMFVKQKHKLKAYRETATISWRFYTYNWS